MTTPVSMPAGSATSGPAVVLSPTRASRTPEPAPTGPPGTPVRLPAGAPAPKRPPVAALPPSGAGAHAVVSGIPAAVWARMQGRTWHAGCVPRSGLRLVEVNYWGFDGYRHRGQLIVATRLAADTAAIFTALYEHRYPIHSMLLPDVFGRAPDGVGANDPAQMAAGNTSAFNCRYVVGQEKQHVLSLHAGGRAIDVNTWENPYVDDDGTLPDTWFRVHRPASDPAVITPHGFVVTTFARYGFSWGGAWSQPDLQHFQR